MTNDLPLAVDWARMIAGAHLGRDGDVFFRFGDDLAIALVHDCDEGCCVTLRYDTGDRIQLGPMTQDRFLALLEGLGVG